MLKLEANLYLPLLLYIGALFISVISEVLIRKFISNKFERTVADVTLLVLFSLSLFFLGWKLSENLTNWNYRELFRNTVVLISSLYMVRAVHILSQRKIIKYIPYLTFLTAYVLSLIYVFFPNLSDLYLTLVLKLRKLFVSLGIVVIFLEFCSIIKSEKNRKILKISGLFTLTVIFAMWIFNYLTFNSQTLVGLAIILILTTLLILIYSKLIPRFSEFLKNRLSDRDAEVVESNLKLLSSVIYIVLFIKSLSNFSNLYNIINKFYSIYIIKTELIKISLGNILNALLLGLILFSLLNVGKKFIKLTFPKERREVEGGSAEALIFNLGVLFNLIVLLSALGITWKVLLPIAGTLGVGIGFGLQTIMNNYISGFILLFSKKLKVGDIIELPSISISTLGREIPSVFGKVSDIGILSTIVRTNDGVEISIPNSSFINSPIVNFSFRDPYVRIKIPVGVSYSSDPLKVKEILSSVIDEIPNVVKFLPKSVRFEELGDSAILFTAIFWIDVRKHIRVRDVVSEFYYKAWYKLKENGIEIPFPQRDVWFRNSLKVEVENLRKEEN
ncbi:MAG: hypothetical protein DSZ26_02190 [Thermovibrio sp.]|nr:MAG: hypothetical protein DSZ26_02190 [Thermovibrio sp.]